MAKPQKKKENIIVHTIEYKYKIQNDTVTEKYCATS